MEDFMVDLILHTNKQFVFYIYYPSGYYIVVEQYYVYDMASFIADIGGYLVLETYLLVQKHVLRHLYFRACVSGLAV